VTRRIRPRRATGGWIYYDSSHPQKDGSGACIDGSAAAMVVAGETAHPAVSADGRVRALY